MSLTSTPDLRSRLDLETAVRSGLRSPWLGAGLVVAALMLQAVGHVNCDTSWFMTFGDKVLDGAVPYVDIADPNPPAAFAVHLAPLAVARRLHVHAEAVIVLFTAAASLLSAIGAGSILQRAGLLPEMDVGPAFNAASFALLVVPALCFAEREHDVLILVLPFLAVCAARLRRSPVPRATALAAGAAAGLALAFKPYYAIPIGLAALCAPLAWRSWRALLVPEAVAAAGAFGAWVGATLLLWPAYLATLAIATGVYGPAHEAWTTILRAPAFVVNAGLLLALAAVVRRRPLDPRVLVAGMASLGFLATYLIQAKGWMNHAYPGVALALLASAFVTLDSAPAGTERRRRFALFVAVPAFLVAPLVFGATADLADTEDYPGLTAEVARLAPPHPRIAALAQELGVGHPLVRRLGGTWIGRQNCLWISYAARISLGEGVGPERRRRLLARIDDDIRAFADDVARGDPDVLLVETPSLEAWVRRQPATARLFDGFVQADTVGKVEIWLRGPARR